MAADSAMPNHVIPTTHFCLSDSPLSAGFLLVSVLPLLLPDECTHERCRCVSERDAK